MCPSPSVSDGSDSIDLTVQALPTTPAGLIPSSLNQADLEEKFARWAGQLERALCLPKGQRPSFQTFTTSGYLDLEELVGTIEKNQPRTDLGEIDTFLNRCGYRIIMEDSNGVLTLAHGQTPGLSSKEKLGLSDIAWFTENLFVRLAQLNFPPSRLRFLYLEPKMFGILVQIIDDPQTKNRFLGRLDPDATAVRVFGRAVEHAISHGVSDIHIEPYENKYRLRMRIDGRLRELWSVPYDTGKALVRFLQTRSEMSQKDPRLPGDAKIAFTDREIAVNPKFTGWSLRVSTIPTNRGAKAVLRLLTTMSEHELSLDRLGFPEHFLVSLENVVDSPHGIVLVTGPTGSGKTTTLYSIIKKLNSAESNILTVEDPVEIEMLGVNQVQVHEAIDLTFPNALRSALRQDPDIILVGEIRDQESARIALQAAKTGHLVLSTLHANSAIRALPRLRDFGYQSSEIADSLRAVMAQRLIGKLCNSCKEEFDGKDLLNHLTADWEKGQDNSLLFRDPIVMFRAPRGDNSCRACSGTGYKGRLVVPELWVPNEEAIALIDSGRETEVALEQIARDCGMHLMADVALQHVRAGTTSMEEVIKRVIPKTDLQKRASVVAEIFSRIH